MSIQVSFPGGRRVDADLGTHVVCTDQSQANGGGGTAPEPFDLFLASLATCAGIYVLRFCQARGIPSEGIHLVQHEHHDADGGKLVRVEIGIVLPPTFPEKYRDAVVAAASHCKVKQLLAAPPAIVVSAQIAAVQG